MRIQIPTAVKKGDSATLKCWYDTEGDPLYAVKWYKGGREFYRYAPNESPPVKTFPIGNLTVKVSLPSPIPRPSSPRSEETDELTIHGVSRGPSREISRSFCPSRRDRVRRKKSSGCQEREKERKSRDEDLLRSRSCEWNTITPIAPERTVPACCIAVPFYISADRSF